MPAQNTVWGLPWGTREPGNFTVARVILKAYGRSGYNLGLGDHLVANRKYRSLASSFFHGVDVFLLAISPMAILVVVVTLIVLADRTGEHQRFVNQMRLNGSVADAAISGVDREDQLIFVNFLDQGQERIGLLYTRYYPEALNVLHEGQHIRVRYLAESYDAEVIWEDAFPQVEQYWGYAVDAGIALIIAWLIVIIHPEFLYIGYANLQMHTNREPGR